MATENLSEQGADEVGTEMLQRLEQLVAAAAEEIGTLRKRNHELEERVDAQQKELDAGEGAMSEWTEQRDVVETRLEGLVNGLEELLAD